MIGSDPRRVLAAAEVAIPVLLGLRHTDLADLVILRALARASLEEEAPLLGEEVQRVDEATFGRLAEAAIARSDRAAPESAVAVLDEVRDLVIARNEHDPVLIRLTETLGRVAQKAGAHDVALDAWDWLLIRHDNRGREKDAHAALLELASVLCDAERWEDAGARYKEAVFRAQGLGPDAASRANREAGLFEASLGDLATAERYLQKAIDFAPDAKLKAEAQVALGALLCETAPDRAKSLLAEGLGGLEADHPDAAFAREQLLALDGV